MPPAPVPDNAPLQGPRATALLPALATAAVAAPTLLALNVPPSPTFWNQALALGLWGLWLVATARGLQQPLGPALRAAAPVLAALGLMAAAAGGAWVMGRLPASFGAATLALLAAAALMLLAGARAGLGSPEGSARIPHGAAADGAALFRAVAWALLIAGVLNVVIASAQVFAPSWADGNWLARPGEPGRATGNLRQPNHLASLLLWAAVAVAALAAWRRLPLALAAALLAALVFAVVLTASRTGLVSVLGLALWGGLDRRLPRGTRGLLAAAPLLYALAWAAMAAWAATTGAEFGGARRLAEADISSSRFAIWADTLVLLREQPWAGVGWGRFNIAWTLTPLPGRPTAFFDHTHNLPLHLAVEGGLPLAAAVLALLCWGLWRAAAQTGLEPGLDTARRAALVMVLMIGLHSLLEYPLWYAHFLLPAAWIWGFALGAARSAAPRAPPKPPPPSSTMQQRRPDAAARRGNPALALALGGVLLMLGTAWALADYTRVSAVFKSGPGAAPLAERIAVGRRSLFFSHHADYAAATTGVERGSGAAADASFQRAAHHLLDTRLMTAWARHLHAQGDVEGARHLVQRLREFRRPQTLHWLEACATPEDAADPPWHCVPPQAARPWRAFLVAH